MYLNNYDVLRFINYLYFSEQLTADEIALNEDDEESENGEDEEEAFIFVWHSIIIKK